MVEHSYVVISPSGTVTVTVTDLAGHLSSTTSVGIGAIRLAE